MAHSIYGAAEVELRRKIIGLGLDSSMPGRTPFKVRIEPRRSRQCPLQAVVVDRYGKRVRKIAPIPIKAGMP